MMFYACAHPSCTGTDDTLKVGEFFRLGDRVLEV